jgi:hypothetical protein
VTNQATISIKIPSSYEAERRYILSVLLEDFLGLPTVVDVQDQNQTILRLSNGATLVLKDDLFATPQRQWLKREALPTKPLARWNLASTPLKGRVRVVNDMLPVLYGESPEAPHFLDWGKRRIKVGLDILGSTFFMLSRYEEAIVAAQDKHERFPAKASIAMTEGLIDRPLVNEYVEVLWTCLKQLCPSLSRRYRTFRVQPTHDVDVPFFWLSRPFGSLVRSMASKTLKGRRLSGALSDLHSWLTAQMGRHSNDPYDTFDRLMSVSEEASVASAFYFMAGCTNPKYDGSYSLRQSSIRSLLRRIVERGHEIGLHPSYDTLGVAQKVARELSELKSICVGEGIHQESWGARYHYLRWSTPRSFQVCEEAGLNYDSTLAFAEQPGFRCGTCYEYQTFNVESRGNLALRERPLIAMEQSLLSDTYMGLSGDLEKVFDIFRHLKDTCAIFDGDFTLLWHNSSLCSPERWDLYRQIVDAPVAGWRSK